MRYMILLTVDVIVEVTLKIELLIFNLRFHPVFDRYNSTPVINLSDVTNNFYFEKKNN